ncbi:hypothetical protein J2S74_004231 [Evansella vedderi]|uniref:Uncharacterized protein n=1 Tax=Evansella vedderi TaxID=38282 RepID=A0ABU0A0Z9_9BACI|nr:hypothetical protein [Evansella vedderi]MDQ0256809.1 hypothetical protein [Evansella vedderi]
MKYIMLLTLCLALLAGCSTNGLDSDPANNNETLEEVFTIKNPTVEEVLSANKDEDLFLMDDVVYVQAEDVSWVMNTTLTIGEEVLEITKQTTEASKFESGTATVLPVGTKIYETDQALIYIAFVSGEEIRYLGWVEG